MFSVALVSKHLFFKCVPIVQLCAAVTSNHYIDRRVDLTIYM